MPKQSQHQQYLSRNNASLTQRLKYKFAMCKAHAAERGVSFALTFDEFKALWKESKGRCMYTGMRMFLTIGRGLFYRNASVSIDRLDPSGPYTKENVVLCRYDANRKKARMPFESPAFIERYPDWTANALQYLPDLQKLAA